MAGGLWQHTAATLHAQCMQQQPAGSMQVLHMLGMGKEDDGLAQAAHCCYLGYTVHAAKAWCRRAFQL